MAQSESEVNLLRLLFKCETYAACEEDKFRLEKYVHTLQNWLDDLRPHFSVSKTPLLDDYQRRISFLKNFIKDKSEISSSGTSVVAVDKPLSVPLEAGPVHERQLQASGALAHRQREELLGKSRRDSGLNDKSTVAKVEMAEKHQEEIAHELMKGARDLKNHATIARRIIKHDNETLTSTLTVAASNTEGLTTSSELLSKKLKDQRSCVNWLFNIFLFTVVMVMFVNVVLLIRFNPKRTN